MQIRKVTTIKSTNKQLYFTNCFSTNIFNYLLLHYFTEVVLEVLLYFSVHATRGLSLRH